MKGLLLPSACQFSQTTQYTQWPFPKLIYWTPGVNSSKDCTPLSCSDVMSTGFVCYGHFTCIILPPSMFYLKNTYRQVILKFLWFYPSYCSPAEKSISIMENTSKQQQRMLILLLHLKLARRVINLSSQVISSITQINAKSFRGNIQLLGTGSKIPF